MKKLFISALILIFAVNCGQPSYTYLPPTPVSNKSGIVVERIVESRYYNMDRVIDKENGVVCYIYGNMQCLRIK